MCRAACVLTRGPVLGLVQWPGNVLGQPSTPHVALGVHLRSAASKAKLRHMHVLNCMHRNTTAPTLFCACLVWM